MARVRKLPSNKWQGLYRDSMGRVRTAGSFLRKGDAKDAAEEQESALRRGVWVDPSRSRVRFDEWAWEWHRGRHRSV